ncbi:3-oxo-tetronate kinase [bioreactor metagenome]|uniref:3-oxo-tetronate kinase n=1 Tax=bioreactor metagenome TaxID=1076179 RepID=A0A644ZRB6_9ZZZZ|nr:3-oxo-tetronate kinase [Candidatus Metalachnospira sp.]
MNTILWGCIADDFTGAADAASFYKKGGLKTVLYNGIPKAGTIPDNDTKAVVIALKIRSIDKDKAVEEALNAFEYLKSINAKQYYYKYCSTFDSTPNGNIGPVCDALMDAVGENKTILCPALPVNKRTVKRGRLYVNGVPLNESSMRNHPLNPMWDSEIAELMRPQSERPCINVDLEEMQEDDSEVWNRLNAFEAQEGKYYIVPDYVNESDAKRIAELFDSLKLITGGSGIIEELARRGAGEKADENDDSTTDGKAIIIAGSCSQTTIAQCDKFISDGGKAFKIDAIRLLYEKLTVGDLWNFVAENEDDTVLIYSSEGPENVIYNQRHGAKEISESLETAMAELTDVVIQNGYTRIIVAGGETSGAITQKLGFNSYLIGKSVSPGVPVMTPTDNRNIRLVLKSGNFGDKDFFNKAVKMTEKKL